MYRFAKYMTSLLVFLLGVSSLTAQTYKEEKVDKAQEGQKNSVLNELRSNPSSKDNLDKFMKTYYLARWTIEANAKDIHKYREELYKDAASLSDQAKVTFFGLATRYLGGYARDNYYPACRFNAMLAIGDFNQTEGSANTPPVPYSNVLKGLCIFVDSNSYKLPDYVRLAALIGLVRHSELGIKDATMKNNVTTVFLNILSPNYAKEKELREEIAVWFKQKALEGLAAIRSPKGPKGSSEILDAMRQLIEDKNADSESRVLAARAIGMMDFTELKKYDYIGLSNSIVRLARTFYTDEQTFISNESLRDQIKTQSGSPISGGAAGMGGMDPSGMDPSGMAAAGAPPMSGMDPMMAGGMSGGMGMPTMSEEQITKVNTIIARIKSDFTAIRIAISGVDGKSGIRALLTDEQKDAKALLEDTLLEISKQELFLDNGSDNPTEIEEKKKSSKSMASMTNMMGQKVKPTNEPKVTILQIKDYLEEKVVRFNDLLNIDADEVEK